MFLESASRSRRWRHRTAMAMLHPRAASSGCRRDSAQPQAPHKMPESVSLVLGSLLPSLFPDPMLAGEIERHAHAGQAADVSGSTSPWLAASFVPWPDQIAGGSGRSQLTALVAPSLGADHKEQPFTWVPGRWTQSGRDPRKSWTAHSRNSPGAPTGLSIGPAPPALRKSSCTDPGGFDANPAVVPGLSRPAMDGPGACLYGTAGPSPLRSATGRCAARIRRHGHRSGWTAGDLHGASRDQGLAWCFDHHRRATPVNLFDLVRRRPAMALRGSGHQPAVGATAN